MIVRPSFAIALMLTAATAIAQPAKDDPKAAVPDRQSPATVVLASAEDVRGPTPSGQPSSAAIKRPAPRVTTCRCGDQQADEDPQPDE